MKRAFTFGPKAPGKYRVLDENGRDYCYPRIFSEIEAWDFVQKCNRELLRDRSDRADPIELIPTRDRGT